MLLSKSVWVPLNISLITFSHQRVFFIPFSDRILFPRGYNKIYYIRLSLLDMTSIFIEINELEEKESASPVVV